MNEDIFTETREKSHTWSISQYHNVTMSVPSFWRRDKSEPAAPLSATRWVLPWTIVGNIIENVPPVRRTIGRSPKIFPL
jgi:hypothetical protein